MVVRVSEEELVSIGLVTTVVTSFSVPQCHAGVEDRVRRAAIAKVSVMVGQTGLGASSAEIRDISSLGHAKGHQFYEVRADVCK